MSVLAGGVIPPFLTSYTISRKHSLMLSPDMKTRLHQIVAASEAVYGQLSVLARIAVAQVQQESGIIKGASELASKHNNLFGIKGSGTAGSVKMKTHEYTKAGKKYFMYDTFAKNSTLEDSFEQHKALLSKPRYARVMAAITFKEAAQALYECGYCTDPNYATNLSAAYRAVEKRL
jgi:flagellum-specific peptidoglycan hydrolase FlgJ